MTGHDVPHPRGLSACTFVSHCCHLVVLAHLFAYVLCPCASTWQGGSVCSHPCCDAEVPLSCWDPCCISVLLCVAGECLLTNLSQFRSMVAWAWLMSLHICHVPVELYGNVGRPVCTRDTSSCQHVMHRHTCSIGSMFQCCLVVMGACLLTCLPHPSEDTGSACTPTTTGQGLHACLLVSCVPGLPHGSLGTPAYTPAIS